VPENLCGYIAKWNHEFIDLPVVEKDKQNTPSFSSDVMTGLARWKKERERMIFVLCGAGGFRVGEALGIEIDKYISPDFLTIFVQQTLSNRKFITVGLNNGSKQQMAFARLTSTRRSLLFSKSSLATGHRDSCSALDKGNPSLRQTSESDKRRKRRGPVVQNSCVLPQFKVRLPYFLVT
jgi:hypothetical protein